MDEEKVKEEEDARFEKEREEARKRDEEKTGKNRARREKAKMRQGKKKGGGAMEVDAKGDAGGKAKLKANTVGLANGNEASKINGDDGDVLEVQNGEEVGIVIHDDD